MSIKDDVATNLRIMMAVNNLTATDVSESTGIARSTLSKILNAKSKMIQFETIKKLSEVLKIEPYELFKTKKSS